MLEFQDRAQRGYRDLVAAGQSEMSAIVDRCPNCRSQIVVAAPSLPATLPERDEQARQSRRQSLQPTAARLAELARRSLPEATFEIWLAGLVLDDAADDTLFLAAPAELASWLADRYAPFLAQAASHLGGRRFTVEIYPATEPAAGRTLGELVERTETAPTGADTAAVAA
jgi:hypothetical protein